MTKTELIDENGADGKTTRVDQTLGWDLVVKIKDAFKLLAEVFDGMGTESVKDPAQGCTCVAVRIDTFAGGNDGLVGGSTGNTKGRSVVMLVAQEITDFGGQFREQTQGCSMLATASPQSVPRAHLYPFFVARDI